MAVQPIPDGYHTVTPYLIVQGAAEAIEFYAKAFGATELLRLPKPDGGIAHAEIKIGDSPIMLADEVPEMGFRGPKSFGGSPASVCLYVENVDEVFERAVAAGAKVLMPLSDRFYGDRAALIEDPFGHSWTVCTHVEDVDEEEIQRRFAATSCGEGEHSV